MAYCKATKKSTATGLLILRCDLAEGHELAHPKHYDRKEGVTWNTVSNNPTALQETRTSKGRVGKSIAAHTGQFDVVQP